VKALQDDARSTEVVLDNGARPPAGRPFRGRRLVGPEIRRAAGTRYPDNGTRTHSHSLEGSCDQWPTPALPLLPAASSRVSR